MSAGICLRGTVSWRGEKAAEVVLHKNAINNEQFAILSSTLGLAERAWHLPYKKRAFILVRVRLHARAS